MLDFSVVLPIYNERSNLIPLLNEISATMEQMEKQFELIVIDDGSTDGSLDLLLSESQSRPYLKVYGLGENQGQSAALNAGFQAARGTWVVSLDGDGQNDPADIPRLFEKLQLENMDFVCGRRKNRKDKFWGKRLPSSVANFFIQFMTGSPIRDLGCSLRVYKREWVQKFELQRDEHRLFPLYLYALGARTGEMDVHHRAREHGQSNYGLERIFKLPVNLYHYFRFKKNR